MVFGFAETSKVNQIVYKIGFKMLYVSRLRLEAYPVRL